MNGPVPLAIVHHANQYLITTGYESRQGLNEVLDGYTALLEEHERLGVPLSLHISGTLLETVLWHRPEFLDLVVRLKRQGLLSLIGGTYSENVMPLFSTEHNRRQLRELLDLYQRHLDCRPSETTVFWVPERVWDTEMLAPILTDATLPNGGYQFVLLDDRLLYPTGGSYQDSPRAAVDRQAPFRPSYQDGQRDGPQPEAAPDPLRFRPCRIEGGRGLTVVPFSAALRYWIPPADSRHQELVASLVRWARQQSDPSLLLAYADDLEKAAGVAGWDSRALPRYRTWLTSVREDPHLRPVLLGPWLQSHSPPAEERRLEAGTFFELAHLWGAGEDYQGWWSHRRWRRYAELYPLCEDAIREAEGNGADAGLLELAWKHLLASSYETGWQDVRGASRAPAPWARALASHARSALVMVEAARWQRMGAGGPMAEVADIDRDRQPEVVLKNEHLFAVLTPRYGARLVALFDLAPDGGRLVIGNPADDWNFQKQVNRYMDQPPNHPGALSDVGHEQDAYEPRIAVQDDQTVVVEFTNVQPGSPLKGARKTVMLRSGERHLVICYDLPSAHPLTATCCLSPDYLRLLREGRAPLQAYDGSGWRGWRAKSTHAWVAIDEQEGTAWVSPEEPEAGHGLNVAISAATSHFHVVIGSGQASNVDVGGARLLLHSYVHRPEPSPARHGATVP